MAADRISVVPALVAAEWAQGAPAGVAGAAAIGVAGVPVIGAVVTIAVVIGAVVIGMAATGVVVTGMVVIGTATGGVITSSSLATSGFPIGGAGVGAAIRTDTTVMVIPTITMATGMATTATDMVVATDMIMVSPVTASTAIAADHASLSCSDGSLALAIIAAPLTGSWGPRHGERFELTSATTRKRRLSDRQFSGATGRS